MFKGSWLTESSHGCDQSWYHPSNHENILTRWSQLKMGIKTKWARLLDWQICHGRQNSTVLRKEWGPRNRLAVNQEKGNAEIGECLIGRLDGIERALSNMHLSLCFKFGPKCTAKHDVILQHGYFQSKYHIDAINRIRTKMQLRRQA